MVHFIIPCQHQKQHLKHGVSTTPLEGKVSTEMTALFTHWAQQKGGCNCFILTSQILVHWCHIRQQIDCVPEDMTLCHVHEYQHFTETCSLHLQGSKIISSLTTCQTWMLSLKREYGDSIFLRTTWSPTKQYITTQKPKLTIPTPKTWNLTYGLSFQFITVM